MRILVDTNVVLDILLDRKDYLEDSFLACNIALHNGDKLFFSSSSVTDIFYIIKKIKGKDKALECVKRLSVIMEFAEVNSDSIFNAISSSINDFEDAVIDSVAKGIKASYILTRNIADFKNSNIKAILPKTFCESFGYCLKS